MSFSPEWEAIYSQGKHDTTWPWSNVISYLYRFARPTGDNFRILELGCGPGANVSFFRSLNVTYKAMDGSACAIQKILKKYPGMEGNASVGDFTLEIPFPGTFDLIIERASIAHNNSANIRRCLTLVEDKLTPGGIFIGLDWFSTEHTDFQNGEQQDDSFTRAGYDKTSHTFSSIGTVHFSDRTHLEDLFSSFKMINLQHNTRRHVYPEDGYQIATWDIVAQKC